MKDWERQFIGSADDFKSAQSAFRKINLETITKLFMFWLTGVAFGYLWHFMAVS